MLRTLGFHECKYGWSEHVVILNLSFEEAFEGIFHRQEECDISYISDNVSKRVVTKWLDKNSISQLETYTRLFL